MSLPNREQFIANHLPPSGPSEEDNCPICYEDWDERNSLIVGVGCPGDHRFHSECLLLWIDNHDQPMHNTCPSCRHPLFDNGVPRNEFEEIDQFLNGLINERMIWLWQSTNAQGGSVEEYLDAVNDVVEQCIFHYDLSGFSQISDGSIAYYVITMCFEIAGRLNLDEYKALVERHRSICVEDQEHLSDLDRRFRNREALIIPPFRYYPICTMERVADMVSYTVTNNFGVVIESQPNHQRRNLPLSLGSLLCHVILPDMRRLLILNPEGPNPCAIASIEEDLVEKRVSITDTRGSKIDVCFLFDSSSTNCYLIRIHSTETQELRC
ncbi:hypothetical protein P154DRAFT_538752 [Amniculicola lignicola CBS 123094]|uniref:RING-type domain-containing protein n=1 Tax=Amniculicola lignicola CBS 123094 TaxID=1392246 RepID=A0A6A5W5V8_9PLEO|nr:hypothetical protein P154DRAFT_538752 [Amniculicola lignicola CBS 123094]